jgi:hypothetical protein
LVKIHLLLKDVVLNPRRSRTDQRGAGASAPLTVKSTSGFLGKEKKAEGRGSLPMGLDQ